VNHAYIIDAACTPRGIGKPDAGSLSHLHPQHLGATVLKALAMRNTVEPKQTDDVIFFTNVQRASRAAISVVCPRCWLITNPKRAALI
jgi:acetyl-CoA C-acetyltransferase